MYGELIMDAVPDKVSENFLFRRKSPCVLKEEAFFF